MTTAMLLQWPLNKQIDGFYEAVVGLIVLVFWETWKAFAHNFAAAWELKVLDLGPRYCFFRMSACQPLSLLLMVAIFSVASGQMHQAKMVWKQQKWTQNWTSTFKDLQSLVP